MSVDFKKLRSFIKIVDAGSLSQASGLLRTAQPALSQQMAALEAHFQQKLLLRSNTGIAPTEAGRILYRHAQILLKQLERAESDMVRSASTLTGRVSIGLATYGATAALALPLIEAMALRHPTVVMHINDSFGQVLSELIMSGRMDMAVIYGAGPIKGVTLRPLFKERLFLVSGQAAPLDGGDAPLPLKDLDGMRLLVPGRTHFLRQLIDASFARAGAQPRIVAEVESITTLGAAVKARLGATILPFSAAIAISDAQSGGIRPLNRPAIEATVSLCVSDHLPLSEAASAARDVLLEIVADLVASRREGISAP